MGIHHHDEGQPSLPPMFKRVIYAVTIAALVLACLDAIRIWPPNGPEKSAFLGGNEKIHKATVVSDAEPCTGALQAGEASCLRVRLEEGVDSGQVMQMQQPFTTKKGMVEKGSKVLVVRTSGTNNDVYYSFSDFQRNVPIILLAVLFVGAVIAFGRRQGASALAGVIISLIAIVVFLLPAILAGRNSVEASLVTAIIVLYVNLYLAHGINIRTTVAILGTLSSLLLITGLSVAFVSAAHITGLSNEDATLLTAIKSDLDLRNLLLAGFIVGALGVLDDVTVTQVSAVWELRRTREKWNWRELYRSGRQVGRDHIASAVNTLVFAYAGASLPLMLMFVQSFQSISAVVMSEIVAIEVLRILIGSIGLIAAVPITTALAAYVMSHDQGEVADGRIAAT